MGAQAVMARRAEVTKGMETSTLEMMPISAYASAQNGSASGSLKNRTPRSRFVVQAVGWGSGGGGDSLDLWMVFIICRCCRSTKGESPLDLLHRDRCDGVLKIPICPPEDGAHSN